jgi:hypothetical protein
VYLWSLSESLVLPLRPVGVALNLSDGYFGSKLSVSARRVQFSAAELAPAVAYNFTLVLQDTSTGRNSLPFSRLVTKSADPFPVVTIQPPSSLLRPRSAIISASVTPSACASSSATYSYLWSISPALSASLPVSALLRKDLSLPANSLSAGLSYVFTLSVTSTAGAVVTTVLTSTPALTVTPSPLVVSIRGGDRSVSIDQEVTVDGSTSYDPDSPFVLPSFLWQCFNATDLLGDTSTWPPCIVPGGLSLTGSVLRFPSFSLAPNIRYAIRLQLDPSGPRAVTSALIYVSTVPVPDYPNPTVLIQSASPTIVNTGSSLRLPAVATSTASSSDFDYIWTELSSPPLNLNDPNVRSSAIGAANLVIRSSALQPGASYRYVR